MGLSPFTPSSSCLSTNETFIYKYDNFTHLHLPLVLHSNSHHLYFYGHPPTPTSTAAAAAVKQRWWNKVKSREVSAGTNAHGNQNQCSRSGIQKHELHNVLTWNDMIRDYVKNGFCSKALKMYYQMQRTGIKPDKMVFISVINACSGLSDPQAGKKIHEDIIAMGFESDVFVGTALVSMYIKCDSLENARQVFDRMTERDVVSWNAIIAGYSQNGQPHEALSFFNEMQMRGMKPNSITMISVLSSCADLLALQQGKQIHGYAIRSGLESVVVGTGFVDMYAKCGDVNIATKLFERMPKRDVVSWNAMIAGYSQNGHPHEALAFFIEMQVQGVKPDPITMVNVLPACAHLSALEQGKQIHGYAIRSGFDSDVFVGNTFVDMYAKCGNVNIAHRLFERIPERNVVSWNAIIAGYSQNGLPHEALAFFYEMQALGIKPNSITIVSVLPACADLLALKQGKQIHGYSIRSGFESNVVVGTGLVDMYAKCGNVNIAYQLFERMPNQNVVSWNAIIAGYSGNGYPHEALTFFNEMQVLGIKPDSVTMVIVLPACAYLLALEQGKQMHSYAIRSAFDDDVVVGNALVDMYAKCGVVSFAHKLFARMRKRDVGSWNAIIAGYSQNGHLNEALEFLHEMQVQGIKPNSITIINILPSCANLFALQQGKQIHGYAIRSGFESDVIVGNALVDMYAKCGNANIAHKLFERMAKRNVVSWNAIIAGYSQNSQPHETLAFFNEMQAQGTKPNSITIVSVLPACADLLAIDQGKQIHGYAIRSGFVFDVVVGTGLVDMYAKCGHIGIARQVFDKMSSRDVVSWNAMILGYGTHGHGEDALALFSQMQQTGTKPDHITFIGVLTACSHAGLVDKGWQYFECMKSDYGLAPKLEHYGCLVDLLGRAGHLDEAYDIIKKMPLEPHAGVWGALLGACRIHCNIELGEQAARHLFELEPNHAGYYVLLSNIYAEAGMWEDVANLRTMMREREVKKQPGCSFIEVNREVHTFLVGDRTHPQSENIYAMLEALYGQMKEAGYVPNTNLVLQDVEEGVKENTLCSHSEKLAIGFGIINTSPCTPIRIMKNLRVCSDCHNATKFISMIVEREIIVRDAHRFHHFKDGLCSCGDYW